MDNQSALSTSKKIFFVGFLGSFLSAMFVKVALMPGDIDAMGHFDPNPYTTALNYFKIANILFVLVLFFACWRVLKIKHQTFKWLWILIASYVVSPLVLSTILQALGISTSVFSSISTTLLGLVGIINLYIMKKIFDLPALEVNTINK